MDGSTSVCRLFFFNDTATTEIYTLSPTRRSSDLDSPLERDTPTRCAGSRAVGTAAARRTGCCCPRHAQWSPRRRSEEHTSELQSRQYLVCRLLLEKKHNHYLLSTLFSPVLLPYLP